LLVSLINNYLIIKVRGMGMGSPEILKLVENCPKGAETLVTRIIHILTEQGRISFFLLLFSNKFFFRYFSSTLTCSG
jgi:hypothetical protein